MAKVVVKRIEQINIHLLKSSVTDFKKALTTGKSPKLMKAKATVLPGGTLYYQTPKKSVATWREFIAPGFNANLPDFNSQHASAVLFFEAGTVRKKRKFAITFGYGRSLLDQSSLEPDFGLRTALTP